MKTNTVWKPERWEDTDWVVVSKNQLLPVHGVLSESEAREFARNLNHGCPLTDQQKKWCGIHEDKVSNLS